MARASGIDCEQLGSTGIEVPVLGLGSSPFRHGGAKDWVELVERAYDLGVTYYDTARSYVNGEEVVAELPASVRKEMIIATKTGARGGKFCLEDLKRSLHTMHRSHIDIWMTHMIATEEEYDHCTALGGFCDIAVAARQAGIVRATGASFHASTDLIMRAIEDRAFDVVMFPFNIIGRETVFGSSIASYRERLLPMAAANGVGVVVMKVLAGGEMRHGAPALEFLADPTTGRNEIGGAVRYAAAHPGIATAVVGVSNIAELEANVRAVAGAVKDADQSGRWERLVSDMAPGPCTRCGLCLDACPEGIEIPKVFRLYDQYRYFGMRGVARHKYGLMEPNVSSCSHCQNCEAVCPVDFDVEALLDSAHAVLQDTMFHGERKPRTRKTQVLT